MAEKTESAGAARAARREAMEALAREIYARVVSSGMRHGRTFQQLALDAREQAAAFFSPDNGVPP